MEERLDGRIERGRSTRERLIATARELFGERGYDATSIGAVLEASGVARGALYHHFATKEALFDAVLDQLIAEIAEVTADAARPVADDPVAALRAGSTAWLDMALDPAVQRIGLIDAPAVVGWTRWRELDAQYTLGGLTASLARIPDAEGRVPRPDAEVLAHMVLAAVTEAALMIARADDPQAARKLGLASLETLLRGLSGHNARPRGTG